MGTDKADVAVAGKAMADWVLAALGRVCDRVVVAGRVEGIGPVEGIPDPFEDRRGPLAGLVAALEREAAPVLVVATDQPWARTATLERLAEMVDDLPVVPIGRDGSRQTTCAVYPPGILSVALDELLAGSSIQAVLDRTAFTPVHPDTWLAWGEDGRSWYSADTPDAIEHGLKVYGPPGSDVPIDQPPT